MSIIYGKKFVLSVLFVFFLITAFTSAIKWELEVGGLMVSITLSHLSSLFLIIYLIDRNIRFNRRFPLIFKDRPSFLLFLMFLSNILSSLLFSSNLFQSLKGSFLIFSFFVIYLLTRWIITNYFSSVWTVQKFLYFNFLSVIFGIGSMLVSLMLGGVDTIGATTKQLGEQGISSSTPSIHSLSVEPNLFAIATSCLLCINVAIFLVFSGTRRKLLVILLISLSILFAYTRSVYVSSILSLLVIFKLSKRITAKFLFLFAISLVAIFTFLQLAVSENNRIFSALIDRTTNVTNFDDGTGLLRVQGYQIGLNGFKASPIMGNGTMSANTKVFNIYTRAYEDLEGSPGWLTGVWIQSLNDTGIIGFLIIFSLYVSLIWTNYKLFKIKKLDKPTRAFLLGFLAGNIIIALGSQLSSILWVSFPYIYWGINMAFVTEVKKRIVLERSIIWQTE